MPQRNPARAALVTVLVGALLAFATTVAQAAPSFTTCSGAPTFACTSIPVPLARSGAVPGSIALAVERQQAGSTQSQSAVLALAGGPGQAADPLASFIAKTIAPALRTRDLIVYDQRGTGQSDPLNCPVLDSAQTLEGTAAGKLGEHCALQLGAARGAFTTQESVQDIETIRATLGYEKLVLYGTSYGTKVALEYAERYPQHVEALVLDSVVPPEGPDPFSLPTFQALPSVLGELCSAGACEHITANPLADVARLAGVLRRHALSGSVYDGEGHRHAARIDEVGLLGILQAGDLNPALRALLPAAVQSALHGNPDPLLRLEMLSEGLIPNVPLPPHSPNEESSEEENNALFLATSCEEKSFPWQRAAAPAARSAEALAALHALPSSDFYPFDAATAWDESLIPVCLGWPNLAAAPPAIAPLPNVPTLILSGSQDLRTPTSGARAVAARIPDSQLLVVPYTGHSVLGSDFSGCAQAAVEAFFAGAAVQPCKPTKDIFSPTPITPTKLVDVQTVPGLAGNPGRTVTAVLDTLVDLERQVIGATLQAERELPSGSSFGGLHGGYARLSSSAVRLHDFTFVPGVELSGTLPAAGGKLHAITVQITGASASHGVVVIGSGQRATGTLGGRRFALSTSKAHLSDAGAPTSATLAELLALRARLAPAVSERATAPDATAPRADARRLP
jgi:pimeloyl-ACP methyl ester carboxylesterase